MANPTPHGSVIQISAPAQEGFVGQLGRLEPSSLQPFCAAGCNRMCHGLQPHAPRLQPCASGVVGRPHTSHRGWCVRPRLIYVTAVAHQGCGTPRLWHRGTARRCVARTERSAEAIAPCVRPLEQAAVYGPAAVALRLGRAQARRRLQCGASVNRDSVRRSRVCPSWSGRGRGWSAAQTRAPGSSCGDWTSLRRMSLRAPRL